MRMSRKVMSMALLALSLLVAGCSKLPPEAMPAAQTALDAAVAAEAKIYAPEALQQAEATFAQAKAEIEVQDSKFSLTRKYKLATELLTKTTQEAQTAATAAAAGKEQARNAANAAIQEAQGALQAANQLLAEAPRGKNTKAELEAMQQELVALQSSLDEALAAVRAEDFLGAKVKADVVTQQAGAIEADIQNAITKATTK